MTPFLQSYQFRDWEVFDVSKLPVFDFSRGLKCISIRDQIVRSVLLSQDLHQHLGKTGASVGVIGAGVCGIACAIELVKRGHSVKVFEKRELPFGLQSECTSRWVDPTQYDWPFQHWSQGKFPLISKIEAETQTSRDSHSPLRYVANRASDLAATWAFDFAQADRSQIEFIAYESVSFSKYPADEEDGPETYGIHRTGEADTAAWTFDAIVHAAGFGQENCEIAESPKFKGIPFWVQDPFEEPNCGLAEKPTVLISGSGDGALQDLLRVTTKMKSAKEIYEALDLPRDTAKELEREILDAELLNERAFNNSSGRDFSSRYTQHAHQVHFQLASGLLSDIPDLHNRINRLIKDGPVKTYLVATEPFNCQYPLNRFLASLFVASCKIDGGKIEVRPGKTMSLNCASSEVPDGPHDCLGREWEIEIEMASGSREQVTANVVAIRHGFKKAGNETFNESDFQNCLRPVPPADLRFVDW